ncbi:MAG: endonuclease III [Oscillospiraceae bacterium]|nr:endonuclease III [Oscillospiraceae bacterium]
MMDRETSNEIIERLEREYPIAECTLDYNEAYHLLVSVRLAAQCTDARVNMVTPALFERYPTVYEMAEAEIEDVEGYIRSTGFYHGKARDIVAAAQMLVSEYNGKVPDNMEDLLRLPGVGRKSANLILGDVYGVPGSVVVDTHCIRLTGRLGYHELKDPAKIETVLRDILPPEKANDFCHRLVMHGRAVCDARKPACENCCLRDLCRYYSIGR